MSLIDIFLTSLLFLSGLVVITVKKPVYAGLAFLVTLLTLSCFYLKLSSEFIAVMQILVYAGAIMVIFMFVIILFQDAYLKLETTKAQSEIAFIAIGAIAFLGAGFYGAQKFITLPATRESLDPQFGTVQGLGHALYIDYFFPFEAIILAFLVAIVGAVFIGRKGA